MAHSDPPSELRKAARVLLVDAQNNILFFKYFHPMTDSFFWAIPGGGVAEDETYPEAAVREVYEETGIANIELLGELWRRDIDVAWSDKWKIQREQAYLARTQETKPEPQPLDGINEDDGILEYLWVPLEELLAGRLEGLLSPVNLPELVNDAIVNGPPKEPKHLTLTDD